MTGIGLRPRLRCTRKNGRILTLLSWPIDMLVVADVDRPIDASKAYDLGAFAMQTTDRGAHLYLLNGAEYPECADQSYRQLSLRRGTWDESVYGADGKKRPEPIALGRKLEDAHSVVLKFWRLALTDADAAAPAYEEATRK